jgi:GABA(A) receptor-associated protein
MLFSERFITENNIDKRLEDSRKLKIKYPDRIPIILSSKDIILDRHKYLIPSDTLLSEFCFIIRKSICLNSSEALFLFVGDKNISPVMTDTIKNIYNKHKDIDNFLYIQIKKEAVFG